MSLKDLAEIGPKSLRPALWVIAFALSSGSIGVFGMLAIESKAQAAAASAVAPALDRVSKLEAAQEQIWKTLGAKLDTISAQLVETRTDVAVLSQKVEDSKQQPRR